jgi:ABC-type uncharacterized transport system auxiliary subunit
MWTRLTMTAIALGISALLVGCSGKTKFPTYYTLQLPTPPDPPSAAKPEFSVAVREFGAPAYLRQGALVYRPSPEEVGFYHYQRWAVDPREVLTQAIVDQLRATHKYSVVKIYDGRSDVDFLLGGRLEKLEEVDNDHVVRVEVAVSAQMIDLRSGKTVWANSASDAEKVEKRTLPAVVSEMSSALDHVVENLLLSLHVANTADMRPSPN